MIKPHKMTNQKVRDSGCSTPALDRALALLELMSTRPDGVTQSEIRSILGFSANLVFRLTKSLVRHGYLECNANTRRFILTGKLLSLAQPRSEDRSLVEMAQEPMRWLRDATGESAHVGVRSGFECIVLDRVVGPHPFKCYVEAGAHGPLHSGAPGKVLLAWLPEKEINATLRQMPLDAVTPNTITSRVAFARHLKLVRRCGYATDFGETLLGHHCLGAPVFDSENRPIASLWITAPAARLSEDDVLRQAPAVVKAADKLTSLIAGKIHANGGSS
ncbi:MAG: IclR family transcriptional regulator [Kiritimatiellae bacterium]|nr:IclR family transcriptional regulator [Kiritimatiellia bacterium]